MPKHQYCRAQKMSAVVFGFFLALFALSVQPAQSQTNLPRSVRAAADRISVDQLTRDIDYLASDALRGRDTFSPGLDSAAQFILRRLKRSGLKPSGDNGTYLQHFVLRHEVVDTGAAYLEVGGHHLRFGDFVLNWYVRPVDATAPVVFVGRGFRVPSMHIDSYAGVDVKGKFVLAQLIPPSGISPGNPPDTQGPGSPLRIWERLQRSSSRRLPTWRSGVKAFLHSNCGLMVSSKVLRHPEPQSAQRLC